MKTILVIEDNPDNLKLVTWMLEDEDFRVVGAHSAEDGLISIADESIDLVLMDISLPGMDGKEATKQIRLQSEFSSLPIFALTAHQDEDEHKAIHASGVNELLTKPIDEDALLPLINHYLQNNT